MHFISIFLFALSANIDNFIVGTAYGIKKVHLNFLQITIISSIILMGTLLSMIFGNSMLNFIPIDYASILGGSMIICMGAYYLLIFFRNRNKIQGINGEIAEKKNQPNIDENNQVEMHKLPYRECAALGLALSINNAGLGIGASITGLNIVITCIVSFVFSFIFVYSGNKFGTSCVTDCIGKYAEPISGIIIILLGCLEICI